MTRSFLIKRNPPDCSNLMVIGLLMVISLLGGCSLLQTSAHTKEIPPSRQLETAATLLNMLQTYRAIPAEQQTIFLQAVTEEYKHRGSADNILRLALLLSMPDTPNSDLQRAERLLEHLLSIPWALRADALNLARLRYQQTQHLLACIEQQAQQQTTQNNNEQKIADLQKQVENLQKKINALTNIEQTVDSPVNKQ